MGDTINHAERAHALLSASAAHRWLRCTAAPLLEAEVKDANDGSVFAKEGTLAHELCELKLRNYFYPDQLTKRKLNSEIAKLKKDELWNDEMQSYTDEYRDFVTDLATSLPASPYVAIEKRLDLTAYIPDGFGTADCIMLSGDTLVVIDFKYGKSPEGRVDACNNQQMIIYALGAYSSYSILYDIQHIKMCICQPRLPDGISTWERTIQELLAFGETIKAKAQEALAGGTFCPDAKTCKYCKVRYACRARAEYNTAMADKITKPAMLSPDEIGAYISAGEDVDKWLSDLKEYALAECLAGRDIAGYKAVEGRGSRAFDDTDAALDKIIASGVDKAMLYKSTPLTLAQIETLLGKKPFAELVGDHVVKAPGKPALAKASDKRPPIKSMPSAAEAFA